MTQKLFLRQNDRQKVTEKLFLAKNDTKEAAGKEKDNKYNDNTKSILALVWKSKEFFCIITSNNINT